MVRDLGSTNGTFVGSEKVVESVLGPGELLTIGTVTFRALYGDTKVEDIDSDNAEAWGLRCEDETDRIKGDPGTRELVTGNSSSDARALQHDRRNPMPAAVHIEPTQEETLP